MNNSFNKIKFNVNDYDDNELRWFENGNLIPYDSETHGAEKFKKTTKSFELLKCPVNPQQTSFKYLKLPKKTTTVNDVYEIIQNFYLWGTQSKICPCRLENLIDIEQDNDGIIADLIETVGNGTECWNQALGPYTKFKEIVEETLNGFKTYRIVFEQ